MGTFARTRGVAAGIFAASGIAAASTAAFAQDAAGAAAHAARPAIDAGDAAWMLTATALVLMMTVPGVALFYGGMVRKANVLATAMQSFAVCCLATVLWAALGYSLAFTEGTSLLGGLGRAFLGGLGPGSISPLAKTIPESVWMTFQMTFAIIAPALICGAFADRMRFSALLWFTGAWSLVVYAPVAHWVWGPGGWLADAGVLDFAGGTVVHIDSGVAGLVCALWMGRRRGHGAESHAPHNLVLTLIGGSLLWVGWFGFNAGSALGANASAGMAMMTTQVAAAAAALSWMAAEWGLRGKPSVLGIVSGAVAGLVAITPAAGFVDPRGALAIGAAGGAVCFWSATSLKNRFGYDDSLDAFGVHGVGGIVGAILTGVFARGAVSGDPAKAGLVDGDAWQVAVQIGGVAATAAWCAFATVAILAAVDFLVGLRVDAEAERDGLDIALHGEAVQ